MTVTIVLADDHQLIREGLRALIEKEAGFRVIGEVANGHDAVQVVRDLRPDVVVMDVGMPELDGIEATRQIQEVAPGTRIVALSMHSERRYVTGMLSAGAGAYVLKSCAFEEVVLAIRSVMEGGLFTSERITEVVRTEYVRHLGHPAPSPDVLSPRERQVLKLLAEGLGSKEIGARLHVSANTVDTHRRRLSEKLGISSVAELTKFAIREGLTGLD